MTKQSHHELWIIMIVSIVALGVVWQSNDISLGSVSSLGEATKVARDARAAQPACGDVNSDTFITVTDSLLTSQHASGTRILTATQQASADVNNDGSISAIDGLLISQFSLGLDALLSCRSGVPQTPTICTNGRDDDRDGDTDHPEDPGCSSPADNNEVGAVPQKIVISTRKLVCPQTAQIEWNDYRDANSFIIDGCTQSTCRTQDYSRIGVVDDENQYSTPLLPGQRISMKVRGVNQYGIGEFSDPASIVNQPGSCPGGPVRPGATGQYCRTSPGSVVCWAAGHTGESCGPSGACLDLTACIPSTGTCERRLCIAGCPVHSVCRTSVCVYDGDLV